jgi:hypothetical protein
MTFFYPPKKPYKPPPPRFVLYQRLKSKIEDFFRTFWRAKAYVKIRRQTARPLLPGAKRACFLSRGIFEKCRFLPP